MLGPAQQPGEGDLCRCAALGPDERADRLDQLQVVAQVVTLEARMVAPAIARPISASFSAAPWRSELSRKLTPISAAAICR